MEVWEDVDEDNYLRKKSDVVKLITLLFVTGFNKWCVKI